MPESTPEFLTADHDVRGGAAGSVVHWLFGSDRGAADRLLPRWIFLRALAAIYFSAFYSLLFQIKGLIGPQGVLPAREYLSAVGRAYPVGKLWFAPTLFWISSSSHAVMIVTWIGLVASVVAFLNLWPRFSFLVCFVCFLSFVSAAQDFSNYQSDGMLLEAGFISLFFVPGGVRPGLGAASPPSRASLFLLQWEWFRIYFESGLVKLISGDRQWRTLTAMDQYYPERPTAYMDRLVHAALAALVSRSQRRRHADSRTRAGVDALSSAPNPDHLLLHRDALGDRRHSDRKLYVPQLSCSVARIPASR